MLNENAKKWVAALRSGEYKQAKEVLQGDECSFCCLGVLCKVYEEETGNKLEKNSYGFLSTEHDTLSGYDEVKEWVGLVHHEGVFEERIKGHRMLTALNDDSDEGFDGIADIIESEPKGLFTE